MTHRYCTTLPHPLISYLTPCEFITKFELIAQINLREMHCKVVVTNRIAGLPGPSSSIN